MLLLSAALVAVMAAPAMAQRGEGRGGDRGGERGPGRPPAAAPANPAPQATAPAPQTRADAGRQSMQREQAQRQQFGNRDRGTFAQRGDNRPDFNRGSNDRRDFDRRDNRPDFNRGNDRRDFGRGDYRNNRNWSQYRRAFNASHRFQYRGPRYVRPSGWYYRRWTFGDVLPSLFWGSRYWINDWGYYDLMPPLPGTVWVRYGDDALLIDRYTGEIIQVQYSMFY
jgi:Ni/Co efflux regulator RcnB